MHCNNVICQLHLNKKWAKSCSGKWKRNIIIKPLSSKENIKILLSAISAPKSINPNPEKLMKKSNKYASSCGIDAKPREEVEIIRLI